MARCERYGGGTAAQPKRIRCLRSEMEGRREREREEQRERGACTHTHSVQIARERGGRRKSQKRKGGR